MLMPVLYLAQKLFSLRDSFSIVSQNGQTVYTVSAPLISMRPALVVKNAQGQEVGKVERSMFGSEYDITLTENGKKIGHLHLPFFSLTGKKLELSGMGWTINGDFLGPGCTVRKGLGTIGRISKQLFHLTDHFAIEYNDEQDELPMVLIALGLYLIEAEKQASARDEKNKN